MGAIKDGFDQKLKGKKITPLKPRDFSFKPKSKPAAGPKKNRTKAEFENNIAFLEANLDWETMIRKQTEFDRDSLVDKTRILEERIDSLKDLVDAKDEIIRMLESRTAIGNFFDRLFKRKQRVMSTMTELSTPYEIKPVDPNVEDLERQRDAWKAACEKAIKDKEDMDRVVEQGMINASAKLREQAEKKVYGFASPDEKHFDAERVDHNGLDEPNYR